ncbi:Hypothetical protein, putative [Bodo saltans]|uniref:Zinc finger protein n=1 Tax=Bodo saltans TaxID=75058 RepID=A0A0S4JKL4_BODSA|nr:Hypothetical protein, putative [Bodo saltans]|eukprot:CUG90714.1 Hypothetical protein, putative [Bodo saltans]
MSRPSSPFVDVDVDDGSSNGGTRTLQTRLVYMDARASNQQSERLTRELAQFDEKLESCRQKRLQIESQQEAIHARFHDSTFESVAPGRATAPPASFSSDDVGDDVVGIDQPSMPRMEDSNDGSTDRASAVSFITDQSISSLVRRLRQSTNRNSGLPTPEEVDAYLVSHADIKSNLEALAENAHKPYDPSEDPRLEEMLCTICTSIPREPAALFDQIYCDGCIKQWLQQQVASGRPPKCPNTNRQVKLEDVRLNIPVKNLIQRLIQDGTNDVATKRQEHVVLLATKYLMEQVHTEQSATLVLEIERRLDNVKTAQRQQHEAAQRRRAEQRSRLERLEAENRRIKAEGSQFQRDLAMELQAEGESVRTHFRDAAAMLQQNDARLKNDLRLLDIEEEEIRSERTMVAAAIAEQERASHGHRIVRRAVQPGGQKCFRCGLHKNSQTLASMHRCFRCSHTFCHDCCNNVGGVIVNPEREDDESGGEDEEHSHENEEFVKVSQHGLKILGWRRICSACYTTCLRGRLEIEQSGGSQTAAQLFQPNVSEFTEDGNVLLYVLTQQERQSWSYCLKPSEIPKGLIEEWKLSPSRAAVLFDESVLAAQQEVLPAIAGKSKAAFEKLKNMFLGVKETLPGPSDAI